MTYFDNGENYGDDDDDDDGDGPIYWIFIIDQHFNEQCQMWLKEAANITEKNMKSIVLLNVSHCSSKQIC